MKKQLLLTALAAVFAFSATTMADEGCDAAAKATEEATAASTAVADGVTKLEGELDALKKKQAELRKSIEAKKEELTKTKRAVRTAKKEQGTACEAVNKCAKTKVKLADLKRIAPLQERRTAVATAITEKQTKVDEYKTKVDALTAKYVELKCRALKKEEADQAAVDACYAEFDAFEDMKTPMTNLTMEIRKEGRAHGRIEEKLAKIREELTFVANRIRKFCDGGPEVKELQEVEADLVEFDKLGASIKTADQGLIKVRKTNVKQPLLGRKALAKK